MPEDQRNNRRADTGHEIVPDGGQKEDSASELEEEGGGLKKVGRLLTGVYTRPRDALFSVAGVYGDDGEVDDGRRAVLQTAAAGTGMVAAGAIGAEYGDEIEGQIWSNPGQGSADIGASGQQGTNSSNSGNSNKNGFNNENSSQSAPGEEEYNTGDSDGTPDNTENSSDTPEDSSNNQETIYFDTMNELPDGACYVNEGGVSGYFLEEDIESAIGSEPLEDLTPVEGDIGYDVDFRDSDDDGDPDSYVVQLNDADSQEDLTVSQANELFENANPNNYCD